MTFDRWKELLHVRTLDMIFLKILQLKRKCNAWESLKAKGDFSTYKEQHKRSRMLFLGQSVVKSEIRAIEAIEGRSDVSIATAERSALLREQLIFFMK